MKKTKNPIPIVMSNSRIISNSTMSKPIVGVDNKGMPMNVDTTLTPIHRLECRSNVTTNRFNHYTSN